MSETITDMIQQSTSRVAKPINKPLKSRKQRELVENDDDKQRIEYAETCKTIKKKTREDIKKYNQEVI